MPPAAEEGVSCIGRWRGQGQGLGERSWAAAKGQAVAVEQHCLPIPLSPVGNWHPLLQLPCSFPLSAIVFLLLLFSSYLRMLFQIPYMYVCCCQNPPTLACHTWQQEAAACLPSSFRCFPLPYVDWKVLQTFLGESPVLAKDVSCRFIL